MLFVGDDLARDDATLLEQAQAIFKPLPANAARAEYPITPEGSVAKFPSGRGRSLVLNFST